jgi:type III secretion protein R
MAPSLLPDPLSVFLVLAGLGVLPFLALVVTSYTKIVVVLNLTRNALGVQQVPPTMVINALAMILSAYIMAPIGTKAFDVIKSEVGTKTPAAQLMKQIGSAVEQPFVEFLEKHSNLRERKFFVKSAQAIWPKEMADKLSDKDLFVLIPAFTVTELMEAFQIGFIIYLAFIVVDFVVATVLLALNMSMISPTVVSVPFKLLLFVALDGWSKLIHNLVLTYR